MSGVVLVVLIFLFGAGGLSYVAYFTYKKKLRRAKAIERGLKMVPVLIHLPPPSSDTQGGNRDIREVMREKTAQAEVLYNLLAGTVIEGFKSKFYGQRHIALELVASGGVVHFYAAVPVALVSVVKKAVLTAYPGARLEEVEDHNIFNQEGRLAATMGGEMVLRAESAYPIATFEKLDTDPMEALLTTMSALGKKDGVAIQVMLRPATEGWTKKSIALADAKRKGRATGIGFSAQDLVKAALKAPTARREEERARTGGQDISNLELGAIEAIEEKTKHPGFEVLIRVMVSTESVARSQQLLRDISTAFALFDAPGSNGFRFLPAVDVQGLVTAFIFRFFPPELWSNVLNSVELATLFHLPDSQFTPSSSVEREQSKQVDGPVQLPAVGLLFGYNEFRGIRKEIRLSNEDRRRHTYILGQTGTGKSTMLENLAVQDMVNGNGFAFIDPHGDSAEKILSMVPKERAEDIIYFNPADTEYPLGLNLFEFNDPTQKDFIVQETINMLYKLYDPGHTGIIGPRYEHWYRNAALTLMSDPGGSTFIEIPKVFTDTEYLKKKFKYLRDPTVIDFWTKEMGQTSDYHKSEMLGWFVSKFGAFMNNEMMRNIIGQTKSSFNIRDVMDHKKILIVNLSKGRVGELNSQLLGMIFVIKFQAAAMSRAEVPEDQRSDFCLYVDEFQNFSTDSFASILSEARKYRLNLIVANQFIGQLKPEIRDAVFGNIGTIVAHRMGPEDAEFMEKQFAPMFDVSDLVNLPNFNAAMRLMIGGLPSQPFSIRDSAPLGSANAELGLAVKQLSAAKFGRTKSVVEGEILERLSGHEMTRAAAAAPAPVAAGEVAAATSAPVIGTVAASAVTSAPVGVAAPVGTTAAPTPAAQTPMPVPAPLPNTPPVANTATPPPVTSVPPVAVAVSAPVAGQTLPGMATTPPPIGAPPAQTAPVPQPQTQSAQTQPASLPQPAPQLEPQPVSQPISAQPAPPPIGAPPVELSMKDAPAPSPAAGPADPNTLSLTDITGGKPLPAAGPIPAEVPLLGPSAAPPPMPPPPEPMDVPPAPVPEPPPAELPPLGSGQPLENDPYANIEILGDLATPPQAGAPVEETTVEAPAGPEQVPVEPEAAVGQPLPDDPYANIDVLASAPMPGGRDMVMPVASPAEEASVFPSVDEAPVPITPPEPAPEPVPIMPPEPAPATMLAPEEPIAPALGSAVPTQALAANDSMIHFVDPGAQRVMEQPAAAPSEPTVDDFQAQMASGLPEGVTFVQPEQGEGKAGDAQIPPGQSPAAAPIAAAPGTPPVAVQNNVTPAVTPVQVANPGAPPVPTIPSAPPPEQAAPVLSGTPANESVAGGPGTQVSAPPPIGAPPLAPPPAPTPLAPPPKAVAVPGAPAGSDTVNSVPETNVSLAEALAQQVPPSAPAGATIAEPPQQSSPLASEAQNAPAGLESVADMLEENQQKTGGEYGDGAATKAPAEAKPEPVKIDEKQPDRVEKPIEKAPEKTAPKSVVKSPEPKPAAEAAVEAAAAVQPIGEAPPAETSVAKQIEKTEHKIDDLLSTSLIHEDESSRHRRLPEPPEPSGDAESGVDLELNNGVTSTQPAPETAKQAAERRAAEHHGIKVIQPLEPIVPPKEEFARELAALQEGGQPVVAAAAPTAIPAPPSAPATPTLTPQAAAPVPAQAQPPAANPPAIVKHQENMMGLPPSSQVDSAVVADDDGMPVAESLAADDVARARADQEAQTKLQSAQAPAAAPSPQPEPAKIAAPVLPAGTQTQTGAHKRKRKHRGHDKQTGERIETAAEAEHNKPTQSEVEASSLTGKLIMPTGEKPDEQPPAPKLEKPKKLAAGEVFVDEHGNVMVGE